MMILMTATTVMMTQDCIVSPLNLTVTEGGGIGAGWGQKWIGPLELNDIRMQSVYFDTHVDKYTYYAFLSGSLE